MEWLPIPPAAWRRSFGASWVAAGVAAQYLSQHPTATVPQVRQALIDWATPHAVTGAGPNTTTRLLYTNFSDSTAELGAMVAPAAGAGEPPGDSGNDLSAAAIVGIAVPAAAGEMQC